MFIALGILMFVGLIVAHEYGHFLVAKRNDVEPEEFGIGFPPRLFGKKMGKGIFKGFYTINLLPLGGFVQLKGETDSDKRKGSFGAATFAGKMKIIYAGVAVNYVLGVLLLTLSALIALPRFLPNQFAVKSDEKVVHSNQIVFVGEVIDGSPAQSAGLEDNDEIVSFGGLQIDTADQVGEVAKENSGETVQIELLRGEGDSAQTVKTEVTLREADHPEGTLGVSMGEVDDTRLRYTWSAPVVGFGLANQMIVETFKALGSAIDSLFQGDTETASQGVGGPVLIVYAMTNIDGFGMMFALVGSLSIGLALMNALPFPALDGGRGALIFFFRKILNRELPGELEKKINAVGMLLLLSLFLLITISDVSKIFGG